MKLVISSLSILLTVVSVLPVFSFGLRGTFYSIDPDVVYVANALSYIQTGQIHYLDHPGTPAIVFISTVLIPLRIVSKTVIHQNFIEWSFLHYDIVIFYVRICFAILFTASTYLFLRAINRTKFDSIKTSIFLLSLLSFSAFLRMGAGISPESILYFLVSIWIYIYSFGTGKKFILGFISGIAFATKFSSLFLMIASVAIGGIIGVLGAAGGLLFGLSPILSRYNSLISWGLRLAKGTGVHGGGTQTGFDIGVYYSSIKTLIYQEPAVCLIFLLVTLGLILFNRGYKDKVLSLVSIIGILIFAKFPLSYYQIVNAMLLFYVFTLNFRGLSKWIKVVVITVVLFVGIQNVFIHFINTGKTASGSAKLQTIVESNIAKKATFWEWGRSKDYALLWARVWAGGLYSNQLVEANLYDFDPSSKEDVFTKCWDKMYLQDVVVDTFIEKYSNKHPFKVNTLPDTNGMNLVESAHCI